MGFADVATTLQYVHKKIGFEAALKLARVAHFHIRAGPIILTSLYGRLQNQLF